MPSAARRYVSPGATHTPQRHKTAGREWYNSRRWHAARTAFIDQRPFCVECEREGKPLIDCAVLPYVPRKAPAAEQLRRGVVDHITPHNGDYSLFWDQANWQVLCYSHHSAKTAREDGGFGNRSGKQ